jgi:hypothetical protein
LNKNDKIYLKEFNYEILNNEYSRENMNSFMEKTRIIRKEKYKNYILDNKIFNINSMKEVNFQLVKIQKDEYFKNLVLLSKFYKSFNRYLTYLETQRNKETQILNQLRNRKSNLQIINDRLNERVIKLKFEITKYQNIKKFLILAKYGSEALLNKDKNDKNDELSFFITEVNNNNNIENKKSIFYKSLNKKNGIIEHSNSNTIKKKFLPKLSLNLQDDINLFSINQKSSNSIKNKKYRKLNSSSISGKKTPRLDSDFEFNLFTNFENGILRNINIFNRKRKNVNELNEVLNQTKSDFEEEDDYNKSIISTKTMKLYFLKIENINLKSRYELIKKNTLLNESFKNKLEIKIYEILVSFNEDINIEEILCIKDLFHYLKMKSDDFFEKINADKLLYMIKIIELIDSFLDKFKSKCLSDQKLKEKYDNALILVEKEKNIGKIRLNRELLKKNLEERKMNIINKSTQVRFFSYKKYDIKCNQRYKNNYIKKIQKKSNKLTPNYEEWLTYS